MVLEKFRALESGMDARANNASLSMNNVLTCSLVAVLGGANDCQAICDYIGTHRATLDAIFGKNFAPATLSRESLRRLLFMVEPRAFEAFASALTEPLLLPCSGETSRSNLLPHGRMGFRNAGPHRPAKHQRKDQ